MTTGATLFSGGELAGVGMRNAGIEHRWGIEIDDVISGVARANGFNVITADVLAVDPAQMEPVDALHASPVCTRASTANQSAELNEDGTKEAPLDIAMGEKVAQFIDVLQPRIVTIENVYQYRNFQAFKVICAALSRGGYMWDFDNLNSADFGVPQTRRRLILRAVKGALLPNLPQPERWIGWYSAIEDLIPTLPESKFAQWQEVRLPLELLQAGVMVDSRNVTQEYGKLHRLADEPAITVTVTDRPSHFPRAFIIDQNYGSPNDNGRARILSVKDADEPVFTIGAGGPGRAVRAYLVDGQNASRDLTVLEVTDPACTIGASGKGSYRAWLSQGRVVAMTPRALARFQSVPDSYVLPESKKLACKVIGNGVPCLLMEKIYRQLI